jgi:hypothetical protein
MIGETTLKAYKCKEIDDYYLMMVNNFRQQLYILAKGFFKKLDKRQKKEFICWMILQQMKEESLFFIKQL